MSRKYGVCTQRRDELLLLHSKGMSLTKLSKHLGTNRRHVRAVILEAGLQLNPVDLKRDKNPSWKGGRMRDKHGYVLVHMPEHPNANRHGYVREHRVVMEQKLGRFLDRKEVVHHFDGTTDNNVPENLGLFRSNGEHLRVTTTGVPCPARGRPGVPNGTSLAGRRRGTDGRLLPGKFDPTLASLYKAAHSPSQTEHPLERDRSEQEPLAAS